MSILTIVLLLIIWFLVSFCYMLLESIGGIWSRGSKIIDEGIIRSFILLPMTAVSYLLKRKR